MRENHLKSWVFATALVAFLVSGVGSGVAQAAPINYSDSSLIPPGVRFTNVFESSATDPVPLYGPPDYFTTGVDFDPVGFAAFSATTSGGGGDVTDGQLNFTVSGEVSDGRTVAIEQLNLFEAGDYSLIGLGTTNTQALAGASIRVVVTEIDGVAVAPINLAPSNAFVAFNLIANPGIVQPWAIQMSVDIDAALSSMNRSFTAGATEIEVVINNQLIALSEPSSVAFIAKKQFIIDLETDVGDVVPEPATVSVLALGAFGALMRRRRGR